MASIQLPLQHCNCTECVLYARVVDVSLVVLLCVPDDRFMLLLCILGCECWILSQTWQIFVLTCSVRMRKRSHPHRAKLSGASV